MVPAERPQKILRAGRFGRRILFRRDVGSTNDWAKELAKTGAQEGTVVLAQIQMAGRGRLQRKWVSPKGGLWFSVVLRPRLKASGAPKIVFAASLAVAEVLREKYDLKTEVKWPNDVLVSGRKICGILAETTLKGDNIEYAVLGVGVNANFSVEEILPKPLKATSTSTQDKLRRKIRLESLLNALLKEFEIIYDQCMETGFASVLERWKAYAQFLGKRVSVNDQGETLSGMASDVDVDGALIVTLDDGKARRIVAGDIVFEKM